jgi:hypothetical protein
LAWKLSRIKDNREFMDAPNQCKKLKSRAIYHLTPKLDLWYNLGLLGKTLMKKLKKILLTAYLVYSISADLLILGGILWLIFN